MIRRLLAVFALALATSHDLNADDVSFAFDVRPILSDHCFACHGFDEEKREAELRLDTAEGASADLGGYRAIQPGSLAESAVWQRVISDDEDHVMPPPDFHKPLSDAEIDILRRWIEQGAKYDSHWSFLPPVRPSVPRRAVENPIDAFLQRRLELEGLEPSELADKETLIRRVTLDLTGLPPTLAEVDRFLRNDSPRAYEELVDELLSRTTYGEHMARPWLDLARYADTHGLHLDNERSMWPYRDWVVSALNQNLPFDDFTRYQLAGDLLPNPTQEQLVASGFNRCNVTTSEGGSINEEWVFRYAVDRTATAVEVWMGLTAGCAVCHDHKFDPLSTKEFYSMYAFFHSAADPAMDGNVIDTPPTLRIVEESDKERIAKLRSELTSLNSELITQLLELEYDDPAKLDPPPQPVEIHDVWFDDDFGQGVAMKSSGGHATQWITADDGPVFSGKRALKRVSEDVISQDYFTEGFSYVIPRGGRFFVYCYLDAEDGPEAIMLQFHTNSWKNRAVWGEAEKINFGKAGTTEKVHMGDLPDVGRWVRLEVDARKVGLKPGTKITGYALTQFGGTVYWDNLGVDATVDKSKDPAWSWSLWCEQDYNTVRKLLPDHLKRQLQGRTHESWTNVETQEVYEYWLQNYYAGARETVEHYASRKRPIESEIAAIEKAAPLTFIMADLKQPRESFVMLRGQYDNPGDRVQRGVPAFLPPLPEKPADRDYNRLDLANWLLQPSHPLTARVAVNRVWQQFFGTGIVETSADFGAQGSPPSHPELLSWLATQFVSDDWDMKRMVKRIVTSHAYRQSSRVTAELLRRDPNNRLLARGPRLRLDAESLRDQALFVGGMLNSQLGGPGVKPYQPPNIWEPVGFGNSNTRYYKADTGASLYRRSLYTFLKRTAPPPYMSSFDGPSREQSCSRRGRSNTPMQALQLMNDVQHVEAARGFAKRILLEGGETDDDKLRFAWRTATARRATDAEVEICQKILLRQRQKYSADAEQRDALIQVGESTTPDELDASELAAFTIVANMLLNLDEVICKN